MAITFNDNLNVSATKPVDRRYGPHDGTSISNAISVANGAIGSGERYQGLTVGLRVNNDPVKEYWYAAGVTNNDLVLKTGSISGAANGLTNTNGTIGLGGTLSEPTTTITTGPSNTLAIAGLQTNNSPSNILVTNSSNVVESIPYNTFLSNITTSVSTNVISSIDAENGLTKVAGTPTKFRLGGDLLANTNTTINLGTSAANTDAGLYIQNKFVNRSAHSSFEFTRSTGVFDTFDYLEFLPSSGWNLNAGWTGNASIGFEHIVGQTTTLTNSTAPTAGTAYYITVYIKPTGTNASVTGTISVFFGGGPVFSNISTTQTVTYTATTVGGLSVSPTSNFNGNVKFSITRQSSTDAASKTRIITFKSSGAIWTTSYANTNQAVPAPDPAISAFNNYLYSKPWLFTQYPSGNYPAGAPFQITENVLATNKGGAIIGHYFDERANPSNIAWWNTFDSPTAPNLYNKTFDVDYGGWVSGKVYTLKTKAVGDVFQVGMASSTVSGSPDSSGWIFVSNGTAPTTWTNGSIIEGDFPIIERNPRTASISTYEGQDIGADNYQKGSIAIAAHTTFVTGFLDQGNSTRGFRLAIIDVGDPLPTDALVGELFYSLAEDSIVFKVDNTPTWKKVNTTTI
jgi:hypothetical protein